MSTGLGKLTLKLNSTSHFHKLGGRTGREEKKEKRNRRKRRLVNLKYLNPQKREVGVGLFFLKMKDLMRY